MGLLTEFWAALGSNVISLNPTQHDRILGLVSHLPHVAAAALVNASTTEDLKFAEAKGFIDTSRIASGPADVWMDILLTNHKTIARDRPANTAACNEKAIAAQNAGTIQKLLENARTKREAMIEYKLKRRELM